MLKSITLIPLFVCCTQPCLFGEFEGSSGFVIDETLTNSLFATYPILLNFMWCNVRGFSFQSESATVYLCISLYVSATHMQWLQKPFFYIFDNQYCIIIPVYVIFKTCAASFAGDWDLTKYWPLLKLAATSFSSEF